MPTTMGGSASVHDLLGDSSPRPATASRGEILLVDDDEIVARAYERMLRAFGFHVHVSHDAQDAVNRFSHNRFDVIVSDICMPGMGGLDLLRAVREHDLDVPVIVMTGAPGIKSATEAIEHGAFRYLVKPIDPMQLESAVGRAVRLHQMARVKREALEQYRADRRQLGDRASLEARFSRALARLWMAYQPIVSWSRRSLFAYEALVRTDEPTLRNPADLFDAAERLGQVHELGQLIRAKVAADIVALPPTTLVFVNVHPEDLQDATLLSSHSPLSQFASRVILEITERAALDQISDLMTRMVQLRGMGYRIAIDDLGAGYAGLTSFAQLEPEVVKVDMSIVRGVDTSATKQKMLGSIISLCRDLQIHLIAEGIETSVERDTIMRLGGDLCQGYAFARPGKPFPVPSFDE